MSEIVVFSVQLPETSVFLVETASVKSLLGKIPQMDYFKLE